VHHKIIYICPTWCHLLLLFYLKHLYMFQAFLAHHQEILYCLVSRYGKRKCALWCPVVWCGRSFHGTVWVYTQTVPCPSSGEDGQGTPETCRDVLNKITTTSDIKLDIYIYIYIYILFYDARNHEPKTQLSIYRLLRHVSIFQKVDTCCNKRHILFYVVRTVHFGMKLYNDQRNAQVFNLCIYLLLPYKFRAFF
jgi:hypothetical protein